MNNLYCRNKVTAILVMVLAGFLTAIQPAHAVDPTSLEPVEPFDPGMITVQEELQLDWYHNYEIEAETNLLYDVTRNLGLELTVPGEFDEHESSALGDVRLRLKYVFNPDQEQGPMVALSAEAAFPTDPDSSGMGASADFRMTLPLGNGAGEDKLHLTLKETYLGTLSDTKRSDFCDLWKDRDGDAGTRDFAYEAVLGYSRMIGKKTELRADLVREQLERHDKTANLVELGLNHDFGTSTTVGLGAGAGIGEDSPDFRVQAGIEFRFGGSEK